MYPLTLETPRLVLREFQDADHVDVNVYERDPEVVRYQGFDATLSVDETLERIRKVRADTLASTPRTLFELAVVTRSDQTVIGKVGLHVRRPEHREAEIWYCFRRAAWGQGYALEAMRPLVDFGFGELQLHRLFADADPRNVPSQRLAEKLGMKHEGHIRENWFLKGEWCDSYLYGLLAREWKTA
ncbi:GNAT family N-acetyltransferase [Pendulispora rubella]|uniref:GNAT family N-acetyltransferase n=1 Tax=Pendulispora rubella TaxID=2741070 RepID=A0ABZ2L8B5_9BACT